MDDLNKKTEPGQNRRFYLLLCLFILLISASIAFAHYANVQKNSIAMGSNLSDDTNIVMQMGNETETETNEKTDVKNSSNKSLPSSPADTSVNALSKSAGGYSIKEITMHGTKFSAEVADNEILTYKGLSGHKPLGKREAMLFIFSKNDDYDFWMKDMLFSIDIIWLDSNKKVVYIAKNLSPETYPQTFGPDSETRYVIEVLAGISDEIGLKVGDKVSW